RFSARTVAADRDELIREYHRAVQAIAFVGVGAGLGVALFPTEVLLLWLGRPTLAAHIATVLALLSLANALNAVQNPAYNLLLAAGRTEILMAVNAVSVSLLLPLM